MAAAPRLPDGARVLHVGPHKTGSTALQSALHHARDELIDQGVRYLSRGRHEATIARFATDRLLESQDAASAERRWRRLVSQFRDDDPERRIFSSEFFSDATADQVGRILAELGTDRTHVVVTLRPLALILRSQYQQYLHRGETFTWESWLDAMFNKSPYIDPTPTFWQRHRHDQLVRRWADVVGPDRLVVVMLDSSDYGFAPRAFEGLLGLSPGTLADQDVTENRSMTWAEAEMVRRFNVQYEEFGLPERLHRNLMNGVGGYTKARRPAPDEPRITAPAWAVRRANEVGAEMAATIGSLGSGSSETWAR